MTMTELVKLHSEEAERIQIRNTKLLNAVPKEIWDMIVDNIQYPDRQKTVVRLVQTSRALNRILLPRLYINIPAWTGWTGVMETLSTDTTGIEDRYIQYVKSISLSGFAEENSLELSNFIVRLLEEGKSIRSFLWVFGFEEEELQETYNAHGMMTMPHHIVKALQNTRKELSIRFCMDMDVPRFLFMVECLPTANITSCELSFGAELPISWTDLGDYLATASRLERLKIETWSTEDERDNENVFFLNVAKKLLPIRNLHLWLYDWPSDPALFARTWDFSKLIQLHLKHVDMQMFFATVPWTELSRLESFSFTDLADSVVRTTRAPRSTFKSSLWPVLRDLRRLEIGSEWQHYIDLDESLPFLGEKLRSLSLMVLSPYDYHFLWQHLVTLDHVKSMIKYCPKLVELCIPIAFGGMELQHLEEYCKVFENFSSLYYITFDGTVIQAAGDGRFLSPEDSEVPAPTDGEWDSVISRAKEIVERLYERKKGKALEHVTIRFRWASDACFLDHELVKYSRDWEWTMLGLCDFRRTNMYYVNG